MEKTYILFALMISFCLMSFAQQADLNTAKVIFYRSSRFAGGANKFIIGSSKPDTVFIKLKNGTYHEVPINDFREWNFVGGTLKLTAEQNVKIEPGKKYYIHCFLKTAFPADKGCFELVDEQTALKEMKSMSVCDK